MRMANDVGHCFLRNTIGCHFDRRRQGRQALGPFDDNVWPAFRQLRRGAGTKCRDQPELVQHGRAQVVHEPTDVGDGVLHVPTQLKQDGLSHSGIHSHLVMGSIEL